MKRISRSQFLGLGAAIAGAGVAATSGLDALTQTPAPAGAPIVEADLVVVNAKVFTVDAAQPRAEAFAVKSGRFAAVGSNSRRAQPGQRPHPGHRRRRRSPSPPASSTRTATPAASTSCYERQFQRAARARAAGRLETEGRSDAAGPVGGRRHVRRHQARRPAHRQRPGRGRRAITRWSCAIVAATPAGTTRKAFELAGVTQGHARPGPWALLPRRQRRAQRTRRGTGARRLRQGGTTRETFTPEQSRERGRNGMRHISRAADRGRAHHGAPLPAPRATASRPTRTRARTASSATARAFLVRGARHLPAASRPPASTTGFGDEWLRVGGVKFAADGSASERTMRMSTPYVGTDDYGILTMTQKEIDEAVDDAPAPRLRQSASTPTAT